MSIPAVGWAREQGVQLNLPTFARIILLTLADVFGRSGKLCPSIPYLAKDTGMSENTVRKFLKLLKESNLIDWVESRGGATHYRLMLDTPSRLEGVQDSKGNGQADPFKARAEPLQGTSPTPSRLEPEPYLTKKEPLARAHTREEASEVQILEEAGKEERNPVPVIDTQPLVAALARGMFGNYPPRAPQRSPEEQRAAVLPPPPDRRRFSSGLVIAQEPVRSIEEQLAILTGRAPMPAELVLPP